MQWHTALDTTRRMQATFMNIQALLLLKLIHPLKCIRKMLHSITTGVM